MAITASQVKELRERTGAGMMECKRALEASNGDIEAAIDAMRASGQAKAAKRAGKVAAEGMIASHVADDGKTGCLVEINCETDFVARSEQFVEFAQNVVRRALEAKAQNVEDMLQVAFAEGESTTIDQAREALIAKIGENVQIRRLRLLSSDTLIGSYLHGGRIGVLVAITQADSDLARDLAMHIAATNPQAIDETNVSAQLLDREREIFIAQAKESGKPDNIIEKMVSGRISKFLKEICLVDQPFVKDTEKTIAALLRTHKAQVTDFVRYEVGEGIEKETLDFAEEVRSQLKG